ncbi:proteasome endopeptidase complex subunit alpha [Nitzschia inconspicua]|uniref:Proteasome endopeptidase complex subunit alpha n=1 Tax=Nitzschia inconspicua TaxID=303405 RepID=A0A9K3PC89_9STRA|nr:proteasome endopeptidase complex subunit alpha [Nitzschia inconspicua]
MALFFLSQQPWTYAAHSRRRVVTRSQTPSYDREITTFNPQGRLEQVEYGMIASERGSPVAVLKHDDDDNATLYLILENSLQKVYRVDDNKFLIATGLSGDGRLLANVLRSQCMQHVYDNGEVATLQEAASMLADVCHSLTRTGGVRPLGCQAIVVGVEEAYNDADRLVVRIFHTDPGGGMEECKHCVAAGRGKDKLYPDLIKLWEQQQEKKVDSATVAQNLVNLMFRIQQQEGRLSSKKGDTNKLDLWTIRPQKGRRGNMRATVYTQVDKHVKLTDILYKET